MDVSFSKISNEFQFTSRETGSQGKIEMKGLAAELFGEAGGVVKAEGKDAIFSMSVNGKVFDSISRSGNTFDVDGLQVSLKGTFGKYEHANVEAYEKATGKELVEVNINGKTLYEAPEPKTIMSSAGVEVEAKYLDSEGYYVNSKGQRYMTSYDGNGSPISGLEVLSAEAEKDAVSFTTAADSDKIVDTIKKFAEDYNAMVKEIKDAYATLPLQKSNGASAVSFTTAADSDKIVDTIKKFAEDYNAMVKEIKDAYATLPLQKSNGASYEPLTSDELEGMSETEIKNYEEKAKQGLLFGDRDLSNLYNQLTNSFNSNTALKKIGIEVSYSNGLSTLTVNEEKLRAALDSDPEQVQEAFTSAAGNGKTMMESMKETLDRYGSVVGTKGILVDRAGSSKAASTLLTNTMQKTIDNFETQIQKWTDKMTDQVDRYTRQFSQLEQLIAQMNAQSSSLSGLMGGF